MKPQRGQSVLPLRPLTVGELLDAAVGLLRGNARGLLAAAFALSAAAQAILFPLRDFTTLPAPQNIYYWLVWPYYALDGVELVPFWLMVGAGYLTEAVIIALLGGLAARTVAATVTGQSLNTRELLSPSRARFGAVALTAMIVGITCAVSALACWVPWIFAYGLLGLAVPALVIDGRGPFGAIGRSLVLSARSALRAGWIRLGGYVAWLAIRAALTFGGVTALGYLLPEIPWLLTAVAIAVLTVVDTVGYATLACLDAALHVETRMRTEGLDIVAFRALRRGQPIPLEVPG